MRILCFSDLHVPEWSDYQALDDRYKDFGGLTKIPELIDLGKPDVIVATGDVVFPTDLPNYYEIVESIFGNELPVVTCLGNHEFWGRPWQETENILAGAKADRPETNVICLDIEKYAIIGCSLFVGGMLFFDGSMRWRDNQELYPMNGWNDRCITDLATEYKKRCEAYQRDITENVFLYSKGKNTILCTHHVPHEELNMHEPSPYSFYSGVKNLLADLEPDRTMTNVSISGHTHKRCVGKELEGFLCVNIGKSEDEYDINYFCLEV